MRAFDKLPQGYRLVQRFDLVHQRGQLRAVSALALALLALTILTGAVMQPQDGRFFDDGFLPVLLRLLAALAGSAVYIVAHEAVHGALMWLISRKRPRFGFSLMYAYAGSAAYFDKRAYLLIAIAPVAVWTPALACAALCVPSGWFWAVWAVQALNISGAAGDVYLFASLLKKPPTVLVQDSGTAMLVYDAA